MKNILFTFTGLLLLINVPVFAQKRLIFSVYSGSGISMFAGPGSVESSNYYISDVSAIPNSVAEHYGQNSFTNFLAGIQSRIQFKNNWMGLLNTQYEFTGGRLNIDKVVSRTGIRDTTGKYKKWFHFISVNPEIGRILYQQKIKLILNVGIDYAFKLEEGAEYEFTKKDGSKSVISSTGGPPGNNDIRITAGVLVFIKRWSLNFNYKHGVRNYNEGSNDKVFSRLFHLRLMFAFLDKEI